MSGACAAQRSHLLSRYADLSRDEVGRVKQQMRSADRLPRGRFSAIVRAALNVSSPLGEAIRTSPLPVETSGDGQLNEWRVSSSAPAPLSDRMWVRAAETRRSARDRTRRSVGHTKTLKAAVIEMTIVRPHGQQIGG